MATWLPPDRWQESIDVVVEQTRRRQSSTGLADDILMEGQISYPVISTDLH